MGMEEDLSRLAEAEYKDELERRVGGDSMCSLFYYLMQYLTMPSMPSMPSCFCTSPKAWREAEAQRVAEWEAAQALKDAAAQLARQARSVELEVHRLHSIV
jgi:hypothetical protein